MSSSKEEKNSQKTSRKRKPIVSHIEMGEIRNVERILRMFHGGNVGFVLGRSRNEMSECGQTMNANATFGFYSREIRLRKDT